LGTLIFRSALRKINVQKMKSTLLPQAKERLTAALE
jgi:hypothetical protein